MTLPRASLALLLLLAIVAPSCSASGSNTPPIAHVQSDRHTGIPETGDGLGTVFHVWSGIGDREDLWSDLQARWDWDGDGTWDTPWTPGDHVPNLHAYTQPGTYQPHVEVKDTGGLTASSTGDPILVEAPRTLALGGNASGVLIEDGHRHDYSFHIGEDRLDVRLLLDYPEGAGNNLDLYLYPGPRSSLDSCDPPACRAATSLQTGGPESICVRFPRPGDYTVTVIAQAAASPAPYTLSADRDVVVAGSEGETVNCLTTGVPDPAVVAGYVTGLAGL